MPQIADAWLEHQERRWLRPDAHRWFRPDAERWQQTNADLSANQRKAEVGLSADDLDRVHQLDIAIDRLRWQLAAEAVLVKARRFAELYRKFDPIQPRVPAGSPEGGQWTDGDAGNEPQVLSDATPDRIKPGDQLAQYDPAKNSPDAEHKPSKPPEIPSKEPSTTQEKNAFLRTAAQWAAQALKYGRSISAFMTAYEALSWLDTERPYFDAYQDPPKLLEELQNDALTSKKGYDVHHIVEKSSAEEDGFSRSRINDPENLVRVPMLKHWEINAWYQTKNETYGFLPPREYLRGKSWEERRQIGIETLIRFGVLKP